MKRRDYNELTAYAVVELFLTEWAGCVIAYFYLLFTL